MHAAAVWLRAVKDAYGERLALTWKSFSLEQVNSKEGPDWRVWEQPEGFSSRGLLALRAGKAASRQGDDPFERFHLALLRARHEQGQDLADQAVVLKVAADTGLNMPDFERDLAARSLLADIGEEHMEGVKLGVFGTPTLVFESGPPAYLRLRPSPPPEEAVEVFQELRRLIAQRPYVLEVKRPK